MPILLKRIGFFYGRKKMLLPKIMIVDDEDNMREDISRLLQMKGYETVTANSAGEALSKFLVENPDLILLDIRMPEVDGLECLRQIKELKKDALVIMVTCVTDIDTAKKALRLGAVDFLVKPVDLNALETAILTHIFLKSDKYT